MPALFCLRSFFCRANEASKQQPGAGQQQQQEGTMPEHLAAADAAHGLVGLASAAAAAAAAAAGVAPSDVAAADAAQVQHVVAMQPAALEQPVPCSSAVLIKSEAAAEAPAELCCEEQETAVTPPAAYSAAAALQARDSDSPETVSLGGHSVSAALLAVHSALQQQQQLEAQQMQLLKPDPSIEAASGATPAAAAAKDGSRGCSPSLQLKLPQADAAAGHAEDCIDSATAAAAEAMHLLSGIAAMQQHQQHQEQQPDAPHQDLKQAAAEAAAAVSSNLAAVPPPAAAAAAAAAVQPAAGSKRKHEATAGPGQESGSCRAAAASSPLPAQLAEALSAAANLTLQRQASLPAAQQPTAYMGVAAAGYDQQQQQQLVQQLLQLQQQQQPAAAWDMQQYSTQVTALQALQMQLGAAGLGASPAGFAALQQQMQLQHMHPHGPTSLSSSAAAAAAAGGVGAAAAAAAGGGGGCQQPAAKRQRLSGAQMAELVASVKHHVQVNPERYTHCVIKDMKEKYPDLELNMGQVRIVFRDIDFHLVRVWGWCEGQGLSNLML
jgi:hypothetical protein